MANKHEDSSEKPSLEKVLRFKQAERPTEAFWDRFDQELHQRMLQTLVKKDPWPIQLIRGLTGRIAQMSAVAAAAAFLAVSMIRPAFVATQVPEAPIFFEAEVLAEPVLVEAFEFDVEDAPIYASADYRIDTVLSTDVVTASGVTREFEMDSIQVSSYDAAVYMADSAVSVPNAFASAGVALVF